MIVVGCGVVLAFAYMSPPKTLWDKIMHCVGYVCGSLSVLVGFLALCSNLYHNRKNRYKLKGAEADIASSKSWKGYLYRVKILFAPILIVICAMYYKNDLFWRYLGCAFLFMVVYVLYLYAIGNIHKK